MTPIRHLRWYIGGLLFLSTVINYIDRQTLSVLAPYLKIEYSWTNADFALVLIAFRVAYAIGQTIAGRMVDRLGTRVGLSLAVAWYSVAAMATSLAGGLRSFCAFRFLLGLGEAGQLARRDQGGLRMVPAARERVGGRAVRQRLVDRRARSRRSSCSALYHCVRQLAAGVHHHRRARVRRGCCCSSRCIGSPRIIRGSRAEERADILAQPRRSARGRRRDAAASCRIGTLLRLPQTWGYVISKTLHRSGVVLHHRLVRDLPRQPRLQARREPGRRSGCRFSPPTSATSSAAGSRAG